MTDRWRAFLRSVSDPRAWLHLLRVVHFYNYSHVEPRRRMRLDPTVGLSPTASLRSGEHIRVGARSQIGERCHLWAGGPAGEITIGEDCLLGPGVFLTTTIYGMQAGSRIAGQPLGHARIEIGDDVWLGARAMVMPSVRIGRGAVIGAGSVVTRDVPENAVAVGVPARVVGSRTGRVPVDRHVDHSRP